MNYKDLSDDEIDMLVAIRADGWTLGEKSAYSRLGGCWSRIPWSVENKRERWLPYYTNSFDETIAAAQYLIDTNASAAELFINGLNVTYRSAVGRFVAEATPRALCVLILEAIDAAAEKRDREIS